MGFGKGSEKVASSRRSGPACSPRARCVPARLVNAELRQSRGSVPAHLFSFLGRRRVAPAAALEKRSKDDERRNPEAAADGGKRTGAAGSRTAVLLAAGRQVMGNVQIIVDADTARAYENFQKLVDQQAKLEGNVKKTASAFGEVSKANLQVAQSAKGAHSETASGLRGMAGLAAGAATAVLGIAAAYQKTQQEMAKMRQREMDLAALEDVKKTPLVKSLVEDPRFRGVGTDFKFGLFAGLQQELGADEAAKAFKVAARAGVVIPTERAQEFGQLFGQVKEMMPGIKNTDILDASMSVFQRLRGDIGKFDVKSVEQLIASGVAPGRAIGTALSFGRTEQGARALQAMVAVAGDEKEFAAPKFGTALTDKEKAERAFYAMDEGDRMASMLKGENLDLLGKSATAAGIGLKEAGTLTQEFFDDIKNNRASAQIRGVMEAPEMREHFVDLLTDDAWERTKRGFDPGDIAGMVPFIGSDLEKYVDMGGRALTRFRKGREADGYANEFLGTSLNEHARGPYLDELNKTLGENNELLDKNNNEMRAANGGASMPALNDAGELAAGEMEELLCYCRQILAAELTPPEADRLTALESRLLCQQLAAEELIECRSLIHKSLCLGIAHEEVPRLHALVLKCRRIKCTDLEFGLFERASARVKALERDMFRRLCAQVLVLHDAGEDVSRLVAPDILDDLKRARKGTLSFEAVEHRHKVRMERTGLYTIGNWHLPRS